MATFWFVLSGVCIASGTLLLWLARQRPVQREEPGDEEPFDLFKER